MQARLETGLSCPKGPMPAAACELRTCQHKPRPDGTLSVHSYHRVGLGCCSSREDYGRKELDTVLSKPLEIGSCEFTDFPISANGFKVFDKVYKIGSFIATWWVSGLVGYRVLPYQRSWCAHVQQLLWLVDKLL